MRYTKTVLELISEGDRLWTRQGRQEADAGLGLGFDRRGEVAAGCGGWSPLQMILILKIDEC